MNAGCRFSDAEWEVVFNYCDPDGTGLVEYKQVSVLKISVTQSYLHRLQLMWPIGNVSEPLWHITPIWDGAAAVFYNLSDWLHCRDGIRPCTRGDKESKRIRAACQWLHKVGKEPEAAKQQRELPFSVTKLYTMLGAHCDKYKASLKSLFQQYDSKDTETSAGQVSHFAFWQVI